MRTGTAHLVLTAVALLVAVASLLLYVSARPPGDTSSEAGFARDMSVHHAQAVEMAAIAERRTESDEVRVLASDMVLTQQAQIGQMQGWLAVWELPQTGTEPQMEWMGHEIPPGELMPGMATTEEVASLEDLPPDEMDTRFLKLMAIHHSASIPMSQAILEETNRPEVETLAQAISASQESEILVIQNMLRRMGEDPAPTEEDSMQGMDM